MLNVVQEEVRKQLKSDVSFEQMYDQYVSDVQDMDLENEILPLIKRESTEYVAFVRKLERARKHPKRNV